MTHCSCSLQLVLQHELQAEASALSGSLMCSEARAHAKGDFCALASFGLLGNETRLPLQVRSLLWRVEGTLSGGRSCIPDFLHPGSGANHLQRHRSHVPTVVRIHNVH